MTSPAPCRSACRSAAMFTAYDSVLAPASNQGMSLDAAGGQTTRQCQGGHSVAAHRRDPVGQRADIVTNAVPVSGRSPVRGCTPAAARPRRRRRRSSATPRWPPPAASAAGRVRADRSSARTASSRARCASSRHGRPSRTNSVSKTPSPRTTARSSACNNGACGSRNAPSSVTTTARFARHGLSIAVAAVELTYVSSTRPRHRTRRRRRLALRRSARRAARRGRRSRRGRPFAPVGADADRQRAARLAAQHLAPSTSATCRTAR